MKKYVIKPGEKGIGALHLEEIVSKELKTNEVCVRVHEEYSAFR